VTPADWDAAALTFSISPDGVAWSDLFHAAETSSGMWEPFETGLRVVPLGSTVLLPATAESNLGWLRLRSGTRTSPVEQSADREFSVLFAS
jgi:hypothetical protein